MATSEFSEAFRHHRLALAAVVGLVAVGVGVVVWSLWPTPQMGTDEEVFRTVDALFTALTARNEKQLGQCEKHLHEARDAGKLPADAARRLDAVIARARGGDWQSAAETLYDFMRHQRREVGPSKPVRQARK